jgi:hypothetical protein
MDAGWAHHAGAEQGHDQRKEHVHEEQLEQADGDWKLELVEDAVSEHLGKKIHTNSTSLTSSIQARGVVRERAFERKE